jgi:hypothetical protein
MGKDVANIVAGIVAVFFRFVGLMANDRKVSLRNQLSQNRGEPESAGELANLAQRAMALIGSGTPSSTLAR